MIIKQWQNNWDVREAIKITHTQTDTFTVGRAEFNVSIILKCEC